MKTVKITTDNKISVVDIPWDLDGWYGAIGCNSVETVKSQRMNNLFGSPVLMIVDEEGLFRDQEFNMVASILYGFGSHGNPIVGDVIFGIPAGCEILPLEDVEAVKNVLIDRFPYLEEV